MNNYARGYRVEIKCRDSYRAEGYFAERSAGSHGPWDVVAIKEAAEQGDPLQTPHIWIHFIQVKRCKHKKDVPETFKRAVKEIGVLPHRFNVIRMVWI